MLPLILAITTTASAATVVTFVAVRSGDTFTLSNPHASTVVGHIRLVPDAFTPATSPVTFLLPAQGTQAFSNVLSNFGSVSSPAILAVEGSDTVSASTAPLRVAYAERPLTLPVLFNPGTPATGSLVLGILSGLIRVNIYEHATSVSPLVSRTYSSVGEQVTRLRYVDLLPAGVAISDGYATVTPLSGQAAAYVINPPSKQHAARMSSVVPPIAVTGGLNCEFTTGYSASTPAAIGATYAWNLFNAHASGPTNGNTLNFSLGVKGYATVALSGSGFNEFNLRIDGKLVVTNLQASNAITGSTVFITWDVLPGGGFLYGTDFPSQGTPVDLSTGSYSYTASSAGSKSVTLSPDAECGAQTQTVSYQVVPACAAPNATVSAPSSATAGATFTASMPAGAASYSWSATNGTVQSGQGTRTVTILVTGTSGSSVTVRGTASNGSGCSATDTASVSITQPTPSASTFTISQNNVAFGGSATVSFTVADTTSWTLSSSLGNHFSSNTGAGSGSFAITYSADNNTGSDTVTLTLNGPGGTRSFVLHPTVN